MTRGRHLTLLALAALALLACAAPALAASGARAGRSLTPGPVSPAPPVLDDLKAPGGPAAAPALPVGLEALGALPSARQTAAFAAGRVAVAVVFLQSDGSSGASTEDWATPDPRWPGEDRRTLVLARVQSALDWWNQRSPDGSLDVFMPPAGAYGAPRTVNVGVEPIAQQVVSGYGGASGVLSDAAWRWPAMAKLGFRHDASTDDPRPETLYADRVRARNAADWAFVVYVVDSLRDRDGAFANGTIAYTSDLFGPYTMLTYDNAEYDFRNFGAVLAHEMGHQFGALDEYAPTHAGYPSTGDLTSGYLGVRNRNAVRGGTTDYLCIMRGSNDTLQSFARGKLCPSTVGQTGLRDTDADTIPDVVDTHPGFAAGMQSGSGGQVTLAGTVREQPWPHGVSSLDTYFTSDVSILVPHDLRYQVDDGEWTPLAAADGAFDEAQESWRLTLDGLSAGHHVLHLEATSGEAAGLTRDLWAGPTPVTVQLAGNAAFTKTALTVAAGAPVRLYARTSSGDFPVPRLTPVRLVRLADRKVVASFRTGEDGTWTGTIAPKRSGVYQARFAGRGQFQGPAASPSVRITVR